MRSRFLPDPAPQRRGKIVTRAITSADAAAAAALAGLVRARPNDFIDPFPPGSEAEVLADSGARGREEETHPRIAVFDRMVVGYGAVDFSPELKLARLVGPVIHPAHRRKGYGRQLLDDLLGQAVKAGQKYARATIGLQNGAARALLEQAEFRHKDSHTLLRLPRPARVEPLAMEGIEIRRMEAEQFEDVYDLSCKSVPRTEKQTRSLLKSEEYAVLVAFKDEEPIGIVEVDLRTGKGATIEWLDGPPSLIHRGLGPVLLAEAMQVAFAREATAHLDLLVAGTDAERIQAHTQIGFTIVHEICRFERKI